MQGLYTWLACVQMLVNENDDDKDVDDDIEGNGCALFLDHSRLNKFNHCFMTK